MALSRHSPSSAVDKKPMALPCGNFQLYYETSPNPVVGPKIETAHGSTTRQPPALLRGNPQLSCGPTSQLCCRFSPQLSCGKRVSNRCIRIGLPHSSPLALLWGYKMHWRARISRIKKWRNRPALGSSTTVKAHVKACLEIMIEGAKAVHRA
jgi:hypothetical protein